MILLRLVGEDSQPYPAAEPLVSVLFPIAESDLVTDVASAGHLRTVLAGERGFASLAFPAVSSGIFSVPIETCARAYVRAVREHFRAQPAGPLRTVRLCLVGGPLADLVRLKLME